MEDPRRQSLGGRQKNRTCRPRRDGRWPESVSVRADLSPGMNTGIGDAVNLAWKLAAVLHGRAHASLLDSYEPERIAFARRLVATTDQAFTGVTSDGAIARRVRLNIVPAVAPAVFAFRAARRFMFRTISQTSVHYRGSSLSQGRAGGIHGGDRLPW